MKTYEEWLNQKLVENVPTPFGNAKRPMDRSMELVSHYVQELGQAVKSVDMFPDVQQKLWPLVHELQTIVMACKQQGVGFHPRHVPGSGWQEPSSMGS